MYTAYTAHIEPQFARAKNTEIYQYASLFYIIISEMASAFCLSAIRFPHTATVCVCEKYVLDIYQNVSNSCCLRFIISSIRCI